MDIMITDANFDTEVIKAKEPVLVDFWATWCGPCQMQGPIIENVAKAMTGKAKIGKINVDPDHIYFQKRNHRQTIYRSTEQGCTRDRAE
jgi:thioredoxin-like negative regulator of GroEL